MATFTKRATLSPLAKALRTYLQTDLRGKTRLTFLLARNLRSLQAVPVTIADRAPLYVDLRRGSAHDLLRGSPWQSAPWETHEQDVISHVVTNGEVAFDIGANIGLHTVLLSQLVAQSGKVCAFEPNAELLPTLRRTIEGLGNAALFAYALADKTAESDFFVPEDNSMGSLADWTEGRLPDRARKLTCEQRRLDDLIFSGVVPQPDFIKCDVEGAELIVFRGAREALNRVDAPIVFYEANAYTAHGFGLNVLDATNFLESLELPRFAFFELQEDGALQKIQMLNNIIHANLLAVPYSKINRWPDLLSTEHSTQQMDN